ncbi:MAG: response regulator [Hahellaceae bacterium]|nr:response regulator [Hahellaceae bacterium]MCP5169246.1 response regulator [Hahellaceae bacterium]
MRLNQNDKIRLNIMMIAVLGGLIFMLFLGGSYVIALKNEKRIENLQKIDFPVIENLILLKEDVDRLREALTSAIILENQFLIEEALDLTPAFNNRLEIIAGLVGEQSSPIREMRAFYAAYTKLAKELAQALVDDPDNLQNHQQRAANTHEAFNMLNQTIGDYLTQKQQDYALSLEQINRDMDKTHTLGVILGILIVIALFVLTWWITKKVMVAIQRADSLKEAFLTTISHELRTPINGVVGSLSLLKRTSMDVPQRELVDIAMLSSSAMIKTVDDILTFTDLMSGEPRLSLTTFSLDDVLADLLMVAKKSCKEKNLLFSHEIDTAGYHVVSDKNKMLNLVRHLLDNAIKYTTAGTVLLRLKISIVDPAELRGALVLDIVDSGPGVKADFLEEIFKPFQQLDGSFKRKHQGMGIGLAMSRAISTCLKGQLTFANNPGDGATARFVCPVELVKAPLKATASVHHLGDVLQPLENTDTQAPPNEIHTAETGAPAGEKRPVQKSGLVEGAELMLMRDRVPNILIVEDNKVNQMVLSKLVKPLQCETLLANNGDEGVKMMAHHNVDLILMDCQMPVMDGFEATQAIRKMQGPKARVPIIAVTANARDTDRDRCFEAGMNGLLGKPVDFRSVRQVLDEFLV